MHDIKGIASTATGVSTYAVSWLATANEIVSLISGILAGIASAYAIYYYIKRKK